MSEIIYLVGQISPKFPITYEWRENIVAYFKDYKDIQIINPCQSHFNEKILKDGVCYVSGDRRDLGIDILPPKDYNACKRSSIAIVNMNQYDPDKPLVGSFFELAWYFTMPEKTVIAFADDRNSYLCQYPFVQKSVTTWVNDWSESCYVVRKFFSSMEIK